MPEFFELTVTTIPATAGLNGPRRGTKVVGDIIVLDDHFTASVLRPKAWHLKNSKKSKHPVAKFQAADGTWKTKALHQLVFAHYHGQLPPGCQVDHVDRNPLNNLPINLRAATRSIQSANRGLPSDNTTGYKGVVWHKAGRKWMARFAHQGKQIYIGLFVDIAEAARAVNERWKICYPEVPIPNPQVGV